MLSRQRRDVYAKNNILTEKEFLAREFNLTVRKSIDLVNDCLRDILLFGNCLIAASNALEIIDEIYNLPESSTIVFLLGNETYEPAIFNCLNNMKSIKWVFIYNLPTEIHRGTSILTLFGDIIDSGVKSLFGSESSFRDFLISKTLNSKFRRINISYPHSRFPQGYSNNFVHQLYNLNIIDDTGSIYENSKLSELRNLSSRTIFLNFIGQLTNRRRANIIELASEIPNTIIKITKNFGGVTYTDNFYVQTQINSRYCLVPPGFFNNQNHRYAESLILGALPLILSHNSIDPSENLNWTRKINLVTSHSFKYLLRYAKKISESKRKQILISELVRETGEVAKVRSVLDSLL